MAGRPRVFENEEELRKAAHDYFDNCNGKPTITGLCYSLGFESRQSFYDYESNEAFSYTVKRLRLLVESEYEKKLHDNGCTGAIFALKNFGWKDKTEQDLNVAGSLIWNETKTYDSDQKANSSH